MSPALRDALRERLTLRAVFAWIAMLAIFRFFLESTVPQLATTALATAGAGLTELLSDVYNLRKSVTHAGFGVQMILSGVALLVFDDGTVLFPAAFLAIGGWLILNAVQTVRHEGATVPEAGIDGHDVYRTYVARRVYEILDDHPQTRRELGESLEADDEIVDTAIERLLDNGAIERVGSEFRLDSSPDSGGLNRLQKRITGLIRRIARPITLEFEGETSSHNRGDRDTTPAVDDSRRTAGSRGMDTQPKHDDSDSHTFTDATREKESEYTG